MAITNFLLRDDIWVSFQNTVVLIALLPLGIFIHNVYFHPLAKFPGPLLWRGFRFPYMHGVFSGRMPYKIQSLHAKYGDVVRVAPNELSFATPAAWDDIYANPNAFPKSKTWHGTFGGSSAAIFQLIDFKEHAKARRAMDPGFSERAVERQDVILNEYMDLFINQIHKRAAKSGTGSAVVDIVTWLNFASLDMIGDLVFGESFHCLEKAEYEDWMKNTYGAVKMNYLTVNIKHYPWIFNLMMYMVPAKAKEAMKEHLRRTKEKVDKRLNSKVERPDILSRIIKNEGNKYGLSPEEVYANAPLFINAASEPTVTVLSGIVNFLLQNPDTLSTLEKELRVFSDSKQLTLAKLKSLPYLKAVLDEGLRMCTPTPLGQMRISPPQGGRINGQWVSGDTFVLVHVRTLYYSSKHFHDPYSWRPERWLIDAQTNPASPYYNDNRKAVHSFGWGPQNCVAEPLAWCVLRLILGKLIWTFDLRQSDTPNNKVNWDDQEVFGIINRHPLDVVLAERT